jgi:hypothetical protein
MRNAVQTQELHSALSSQQNRFLQILKDLGAHQTPHFLLDAPRPLSRPHSADVHT